MTRKIVTGIALAIAFVGFVAPFLALAIVFAGPLFAREPSSSNSAKASEVQFLSLPASAQDIKFYDSHHYSMAVFKVDEALFRKMFPETTFTEITKFKHPVYYTPNGYGDPKNPPWKQDEPGAEATDGLIYEKIAGNGGGVTMIYDRNRGVGFYNWAAW